MSGEYSDASRSDKENVWPAPPMAKWLHDPNDGTSTTGNQSPHNNSRHPVFAGALGKRNVNVSQPSDVPVDVAPNSEGIYH